MRVKWEPAALMILVLGLGFWLAVGPASRPSFPVREGATQLDIRVADTRGVLEAWKPTPDATLEETRFRVFMKDQPPSREFTAAEIREFYPSVPERAMTLGGNSVFRTLNITSWVGVVWVGIGLLGQLAFSGRMLLQWIISERKRESVITESFWWFSMFGALMLFTYFVWRQDPVGILGQASGIVIYGRNIRLHYKKRRRAREDRERLLTMARTNAEEDAADAAAAANVAGQSGNGSTPPDAPSAPDHPRPTTIVRPVQPVERAASGTR